MKHKAAHPSLRAKRKEKGDSALFYTGAWPKKGAVPFFLRHWMVDTLESLHRISWRVCEIMLVFVFCGSLTLTNSLNAADQETAPASVSKSRLSSAEGELKSVHLPKKSVRKSKSPNIVLPKVDPAEEKAEGTDVTVEGTASGHSFYGLGINIGTDYAKRTSREIWFNLVEGVRFIGVKSVMELQEGDKIRLVYKELAESKKKILKSVQFLEKAPPEPVDTTPEPPPTSVAPEPVAEEPEAENE